MAIITPANSAALSSRAICIPDSPDWKAIISGKLLELTWLSSWQQVAGITPAQAVAEAEAVLYSWLDETCQCAGGTAMGNSVQIVRVAHTAPYDTPPQQNTPQGFTLISGWCNEIQRDDTGLAHVDGDVLYLPAGHYEVQGHHIAIFSNDVGFLQLFQQGQQGFTVRGTLAYSYMNQLINGDFDIGVETGVYLYQYCRVGTTAPYATKALEGNPEIYGSVTFMRIAAGDDVAAPDEPGNPAEWPITIDWTDGSAHGWTLSHCHLDGANGIKGDLFESRSHVTLDLAIPATTITRITLMGATGSLTTPGTGDNMRTRGYLSGANPVAEWGPLLTENDPDSEMEWTGSQSLDALKLEIRADYPSDVWLTGVVIDGVGDIPDEFLQE